MTSHEIRYQNFMALFAQYKAARPEEPAHGMLKKFAEAAGISDRIASHYKGRRKQIGPNAARRIEGHLGKPDGWLDLPHPAAGGWQPAGAGEALAGDLEFVGLAQRLYALDKAAARRVLGEMLSLALNGENRARNAGAALPAVSD